AAAALPRPGSRHHLKLDALIKYVQDATTGQEIRTLRGHERDVWGVALSPDGEPIGHGRHGPGGTDLGRNLRPTGSHPYRPHGAAVRRFKKLLERSGIVKELRKRRYYEKPCETRRRAELRKKSNIRKAKLLSTNGSQR